jgi:hypothetical protein
MLSLEAGVTRCRDVTRYKMMAAGLICVVGVLMGGHNVELVQQWAVVEGRSIAVRFSCAVAE